MADKLEEMMGQIQEAQKQAENIKKKLADTEVWEGDDDVAVTLTAQSVLKDININERLLDNKEELEDKLLSMLNRALEKARELHDNEMREAARGMLSENG